jgi:hypothetical protein
MHRVLVAVTLLMVGVGAADDAAEARKVVDRAVEAAGGAKKLAGLTGGVWKTVGMFQGRPSRADFRGLLPGKFRIDSTRMADGKKVVHSRIVDGEKGWVVEGSSVKAMTTEEIARVKQTFYHKQTATTLVPLTDKEVRLSLAGKAVQNGRPATRVKVVRPGQPDLLLTFDAETHLLVRSEMTAKGPRSGKSQKVELEFSGHKEFDGVKMPAHTKTYHDGQLFLESEIVEFRQVKSLPAKTFTPDGG